MRAAYVRLRFTQDAAVRLYDAQQIETIEDIRVLRDSDIENLCKVLRRPGGTIPAGAAGAVAPDPGVQVSLRAESNLKLARYWLRHRVRISRAVTVPSITIDNIEMTRELRVWEDAHENPKEVPTIDTRDWPKTIEAMEEYLRNYLGETGIPLAYVVRKNEAVKPEADDPPGNYTSSVDEMIARAPHKDVADAYLPVYLSDRQKVWKLLADICRDTECWTYIKPAQRTRNGRLAFEKLYGHYLGPNNVDNMATAAEKKLATVRYDGEKKRWNFERYVRTQVDQHSILEGLVEYGYSGIDERSKVRHLMNGVHAPGMDSVGTQILSTARLRTDFDSCVSLYKDYIKQSKVASGGGPELQIAAVGTHHQNPKGKGSKGGTGIVVEDRYYTAAEYGKFDANDRKRLSDLRSARGHVPNKRRRMNDDMTRTISALTVALNAAQVQPRDNEIDDGAETPVITNATGNRNNSALTRQRRQT